MICSPQGYVTACRREGQHKNVNGVAHICFTLAVTWASLRPAAEVPPADDMVPPN